ADPPDTLWDRFGPLPDDDIWTRCNTVNLQYAVLKKVLCNHVRSPKEPWGAIIPEPGLLAGLSTAAQDSLAGSLPDHRLRPHLDQLCNLLEHLAREGLEAGLILSYEYAMDGPGWQDRLEPRWIMALPSGLQLAFSLHDRKKELRSAFFP